VAEKPKPAAKPGPAVVAARDPDPRLAVERTIWHPEAARRRAFVRLAGRSSATEVREGDTLGGAEVRRIDPSGVVFAYEGRELRRSVGAAP
jgi:type II secretory pathway component PulC